jgi:hypothetical protein
MNPHAAMGWLALCGLIIMAVLLLILATVPPQEAGTRVRNSIWLPSTSLAVSGAQLGAGGQPAHR